MPRARLNGLALATRPFRGSRRARCCSWAIYFSAAAAPENDQGSMNLASKTAPVASTRPSRVAAIQRIAGCRTCRWMSVSARMTPAVKGLGSNPELDEEVARAGPPARPRPLPQSKGDPFGGMRQAAPGRRRANVAGQQHPPKNEVLL